MNRLQITAIVDAMHRVSRSRIPLNHFHLNVETMSLDDVPIRHPLTDGKENQWEAIAILNFCSVET